MTPGTQDTPTKPRAGRDHRGHGLTPRQLSCLALSSCEGLTQQQIARRLGIGQRSVSQHIAAARAKLAAAGRQAALPQRPRGRQGLSFDPAGLDAVEAQGVVGIW